jgi:hypothetical protein
VSSGTEPSVGKFSRLMGPSGSRFCATCIMMTQLASRHSTWQRGVLSNTLQGRLATCSTILQHGRASPRAVLAVSRRRCRAAQSLKTKGSGSAPDPSRRTSDCCRHQAALQAHTRTSEPQSWYTPSTNLFYTSKTRYTKEQRARRAMLQLHLACYDQEAGQLSPAVHAILWLLNAI